MILSRLGLILNREARRGVAPSKTPLPPRLRKERGIQGVRLIHKNQRGFTLIEMVMAIAITGLVMGAAAMTIFQVFDLNTRTSNHMIAVRQVQNAGYWVSHDAQMAQIVKLDDPETTGVTEFLTLTWTDWDNGDEYQAVYTLLADNKLQREHYTNRHINPDPDTTIFVAEYVNPDPLMTKCEFTDTDGDGVEDKLTLTVTATVDTQSETRVYEVIPRPGS